MSQEPEDVKPKLNLNIQYDGTRARHTRSFAQRAELTAGPTFFILIRDNGESEDEHEVREDI